MYLGHICRQKAKTFRKIEKPNADRERDREREMRKREIGDRENDCQRNKKEAHARNSCIKPTKMKIKK